MVLDNLVYSNWSKKTPAQQAPPPSAQLVQGTQYNRFMTQQVNTLMANEINGMPTPTGSFKEGFIGMSGPTAVTAKNQKELDELNQIDTDMKRKLSKYATSHKTLMEKTQNFLQIANPGKGRNTNMYVGQLRRPEEIMPKWEGCYMGGAAAGLTNQDDMKGISTIDSCKTRTSDLNYSVFSLNGAGECWTGTDLAKVKASGPALKAVAAYGIVTQPGVNLGGLLWNGQIGVYKDSLSVPGSVITVANAVPTCDMAYGGLINPTSTIASYGLNCNGKENPNATPPVKSQKSDLPLPWNPPAKIKLSPEFANNKCLVLADEKTTYAIGSAVYPAPKDAYVVGSCDNAPTFSFSKDGQFRQTGTDLCMTGDPVQFQNGRGIISGVPCTDPLDPKTLMEYKINNQIRPKALTNKCLNIGGQRNTDGNPLILWDCATESTPTGGGWENDKFLYK